MEWILVVMISLFWCEVDAIRGLNASQCHSNMISDWHDQRYVKSELAEPEKAYWDSCQMGERADAAPGVRQECRTLSDAKRNRLFSAFRWLFTTRPPGSTLSRYDIFSSQHRFSVSPSAHFGPCFPGWHRQYLTNLERSLQEFDQTLNLCYWDSSLDSSLPDAAQSCLWTAEYFGNGQGPVTSGFAANRRAYPDDCRSNGNILTRSCGGNNLLFNPGKIAAILRSGSFSNLIRPYPSNVLESTHGEVHGFCGGHMSSISCAVIDPVFWFHHTFIDYLWEQFRERQTTDREGDYPNDGQVPANQRPSDTMFPFQGLTCRDGLSNNYIPGNYRYEPTPGLCSSHGQCGGKALWCNNGRCTACVGSGGWMGNQWPSAACYISGCRTTANVNNVCTCVG